MASPNAANRAKAVVQAYTACLSLKIGAAKDNKIIVMDNGYKNINTGMASSIIFVNPTLAIKKPTIVVKYA